MSRCAGRQRVEDLPWWWMNAGVIPAISPWRIYIHCCHDVEVLVVSLRPYYLPREFSHAVAVTVYIPPKEDPKVACDVIQRTVTRIQSQHSNALIILSGDFNRVDVGPSIDGFTQYVDCLTRDNAILDLCYVSVKSAYTVVALPPLGKSDHNLMHRIPTYKPCVRRLPATK